MTKTIAIPQPAHMAGMGTPVRCATVEQRRRTMAEWAAAIGSRARTHEGMVRAIRAHIASQPIRNLSAAGTDRPERRCQGMYYPGYIYTSKWLTELATINIHAIPATKRAWHEWYRIARCLRSGRYMEAPTNQIPYKRILFARQDAAYATRCLIFPGRLRPSVHGHTGYYRWRGQWKSAPGAYVRSTLTAICGAENLRAFLAAPGSIRHPAALADECARYDRARRVYLRWRWDGEAWVPTGIAIPMPAYLRAYGYGPFEHGEDSDACEANIRHKLRIVAEREASARGLTEAQAQRIIRAASLLARIARRTMVRAEHVRAVGACDAGIRAWCSARGISPTEWLPLSELYKDDIARPYALRIAERLLRDRIARRDTA